MNRLRRGLLFLVVLLCIPAWAQLGLTPPATAPAQPEISTDSLGRSTPRGTLLGFLVAARDGNKELSPQYLNTRLRGEAATVLAHHLYVVLDRRLPPKLNELSRNPEGSLSNPLKPTEELVGTISSVHGNVDIILERVNRGKGGPVWLFSTNTLNSIPDLYDEIDVVPVENVLPAFLVNNRIVGIPLFEWLAVLAGMPLFYLLISLLSRILGAAVGLLLRRRSPNENLRDPQVLPKPIRLLLLAFVIRWLLSIVSLPLPARQAWSGVAAVITTAAVVWLLILLNSRAEHFIRRRLHVQNLKGTTAILRLGRSVVDVLIIFGGAVQILSHFGVNPTAALAGLGVGGIAVALAAQKTLENVIGGISLIFDQAVQVGDTIKVGEKVGVVTEIGLRSTRIRTLDRTMLSVPNGQIAGMTLENLSARDKFWLHPILPLRYSTTSSQVDAVLEGIRNLLEQNRGVESGTSGVRLMEFGPSSLEIEVSAYVFARDWSEFLELQQGLLLRIKDCIDSTGAQIALPSQTVFLTSAATSEEDGARALLPAATADKKVGGKVFAAKAT